MTVRCLLVDDEELARLHLGRLLTAHPDFQNVGEASNGIEALELISELSPEVVFLDIEMPALGGFEMLAELRQRPLIVFATAYDEHAVRAFDANAIDYLLKPIQPARLAQSLLKIRARLDKPEDAFSQNDYQASLAETIAALRPAVPMKLVGRRGRRIILVSPSDIIYAAIEDKLVFLHTQGERFLSDRTVTELDELLSGAGFFRISRTAVVNLEHARELLPCSSGTWRLKLSTGAELEVSRDRFRSLKSRIS